MQSIREANKSDIAELSELRKDLSVLLDNNKIIGFANFYNFKPNNSAFIGNVIIDKNYRSKGLGKLLISYMLNMAYDKYNLPEVKISVFSENTRALLLYSGFGFTPYEIEDKINTQGKRVALIHMKKTRGAS